MIKFIRIKIPRTKSRSGDTNATRKRLLNNHDYVTLTIQYVTTNPSGPAVIGVGLWPLACWDCGYNSHRGHECPGRGLCDGSTTRPESYRVWCIWGWSHNFI